MALGVLSRPLDLAAGGTARWMTRHLRLAVPVVIFLICGSFAAATLLNMRLERSHDLEAANRYEQRRAVALAQVTGGAPAPSSARRAGMNRSTMEPMRRMSNAS